MTTDEVPKYTIPSTHETIHKIVQAVIDKIVEKLLAQEKHVYSYESWDNYRYFVLAAAEMEKVGYVVNRLEKGYIYVKLPL